jgi:hypothetical protein
VFDLGVLITERIGMFMSLPLLFLNTNL